MSRFNRLRGKTSNFSFEELKDDDVEFCLALIKKVIIGQVLLKGPNIYTLVGKSKGKIVGLITGLVPQSPQVSVNPRIFFLYPVEGKFARQGLTVRLLNEFIKAVKNRLPNAGFIDVIVNPRNVSFVALYSLNGFVINGFVQGSSGSPDQVFLRGKLGE
uniref:N-acetyltransferase domain-containing protein n=1 Tax=uncultured marine crenarchaeote E37-7F TaxID=907717 RepID=G9BAN6_9ARCH|nr:hypothetical protein E37-7F_9 [uncultured marine crenarchaeote E37-7F]